MVSPLELRLVDPDPADPGVAHLVPGLLHVPRRLQPQRHLEELHVSHPDPGSPPLGAPEGPGSQGWTARSPSSPKPPHPLRLWGLQQSRGG